MQITSFFIDYTVYILVKLISYIVVYLPKSILYKFGEALGILAFLLLKKYRMIVINNLTYIYSNIWDNKKIVSVAKEVFKNQGKNLVEFLQLYTFSEAQIKEKMSLVNSHYLDEALKKQKGVIVVSIHIGNFELGLARLSADYPLHVVGRPLSNKIINNFVNKFYQEKKVGIIHRGEENFKERYLNCLRENKVLVIAIDLNARTKGILIDFLGKKALTFCSSIAIAKKMQSPIVPVFCIRENDNHHKIIFEKEVELQFTSDNEKDMLDNTIKINKIAEEYINKYPEQWFWLHKRWEL